MTVRLQEIDDRVAEIRHFAEQGDSEKAGHMANALYHDVLAIIADGMTANLAEARELASAAARASDVQRLASENHR